MNKNDLIKQIRAYIPYNEQEEKDKELILQMLETEPNLFKRECGIAHMTSSAWVVNHNRDKVLMVYHNIFDSWSWLGGHADGEEDLLKVAIKEIQEESGIQNVRPVTEDIFSLESLTVDGHIKRGEYVPSHIHLNVTYLLEADENEMTQVKADENSGVAWFTPQEACDISTEPWFVEYIYKKLIEKTKKAVDTK